MLVWHVYQSGTLAGTVSFSSHDSAGATDTVSNIDCFIIRGTLVQIAEINSTHYCYSTLTVIPGTLTDNLTLVSCSRYESLEINCTHAEPAVPSPTLQHTVAGIRVTP